MRAIILVGFATTLFLSAPAAFANECEDAIRSNTIKTYVALAHCVNKLEARMPQGNNADLGKFRAMRRLQISKQIDQKLISQDEGHAQIQAVIVDVQTEIQKRDAHAQAAQAANQVPQSSQPKGMMFCNTLGFSTICY